MDSIESVIASGGASGIAISVLFLIYKFCQNRHIRSKCCGKEIDIDTDVSTPKVVSSKNPLEELVGKSYGADDDLEIYCPPEEKKATIRDEVKSRCNPSSEEGNRERLSGGKFSQNEGRVSGQYGEGRNEENESGCCPRNDAPTEDIGVKSVP